ncbi:MAG TPA: type II secretion system protein GspL [Steroidobacteraceae bacterium]|jgi:general secretion pathway protein L|nr:type II secretion system protein GspL [Steroidobacteraceae bacterium]
MADMLIVRLARDDDQPTSWATLDARGQLSEPMGSDRPASLAAEATGRCVVLLVPGADVLQLSADLPAGNEQRLAQIVPYALEEQVAEDIESLHFATGPRLASKATAVDVVSRTLLDGWLASAAQLGLAPQAVHADSELVPVLPGHVTALLEADSVTLRAEGHRAAVLPAENLELALDMAFDAGQIGLATMHLIVYATSVDWQRYSAAVEQLRTRFASLKVQLVSAGVLPLLAQHLPQSGAINLLQGRYQAANSGRSTWRAWRVAAILAVALIGLHILGKGMELRRLHAAERAVDASIVQTFKAAMPGEQNTTDARRRMEQRLGALRSSASDQSGLLALLSAVAGAHGASPQTRIEAISYRKGALELRVAAPDVASLELMNKSLRGKGYSSEITAGTSRGKDYEGRVQVRSAGS